MAILFIFLLGVGNFTLHKAVLESGHPWLVHLPWVAHPWGRRMIMIAEFFVLLGALLLVANGDSGWGWAYLVYTACNALSAWFILSGRI